MFDCNQMFANTNRYHFIIAVAAVELEDTVSYAKDILSANFTKRKIIFVTVMLLL